MAKSGDDAKVGAKAPCDCGGAFDAEAAIRALSRDVARLADLVAAGGGRARGGRTAKPASPAPKSRTRSIVGEADVVPEYIRILKESRKAQEEDAESASGIVGGRPTRDFPSCCCIGDDAAGFYCSAALVRPRVVLTAGHCDTRISRVFAKGWDVDLLDRGEVLRVAAAVRHPDYHKTPDANDISVLILEQPATTKPVDLATAAEMAKLKSVEVVGFGYNDRNRPLGFGTKRRVTVPVAAIQRKATDDLAEAASRLGFDPAFEFVAGRKLLGKDSCNGDSGGPVYLVTDKGAKLVGLTSRATAEAEDNCGDGGIYVRPDRHLDWIKSVVAAHGLTW